MDAFWWLYMKWCLLCENNLSVPFWMTFSVPLHKKCYFKHLKNEKWIFLWNMSKNLFGNIVCHLIMNTYAKLGHIWTNYVMKVAKTLFLCPESYECSFVIASIWEHFSSKTSAPQLYFFVVTRSHIMTLREGFPLFWFFLNFVCSFENLVEFVAVTVRV